MKRVSWALAAMVGLLASNVGAEEAPSDVNPLRQWGQWRGPLGTGVAPESNPPIEWGEGHNVRWIAELPGLGHASPVVWGDRVYVTSAVPVGEPLPPKPSQAPGAHNNLPVTQRHQYVAIAIDRSNGQIAWQRTLHEALPVEQGHYTASQASNSPVTDGERLYAFFGSHGLFCLDREGNVLWERFFGEYDSFHGHGEGASPALYGDSLIVNWDHQGQSFVAALDKRTGRELWKSDRKEITSWATPIVVEHNGKPQVIVSGASRVRGYDLETGEVLWECAGLSDNVVASPVSADGILYAGNSYVVKALFAVRLDGARGEISQSDNVLWRRSAGTPYVPSPLLYGEWLYYINHYGSVMTRVHGPSGRDDPGEFRLPGLREVYSSPVAAADRVYVTDRDGETVVFAHGADPKLLASNHLDDSFSSSAAIAGDEIYLRGERKLYCIAHKP